MQGLKKSKRVSWASDADLCQTRLFLSEDVPALVGLGTEDHLQVKATWTSHSDGVGSEDNLPPGFEGTQPVGVLKNSLAQIPVIKWKSPPKFVLSPKWLVVSGEESKEVNVQTQREMRMLEAIYPRQSAIPPNPLLASAEESFHDDHATLVVPITAIEEEEEEEDGTTDPSHLPVGIDSDPVNSLVLPPTSTIHSPQASPISSGMESNLVAAAQAALGAALLDSSQDNLIDRDILMSILSDPQMVAQLINNVGATSGTQNLAAVSTLPAPLVPMPNISNAPGRDYSERPLPINRRESLVAQVSKPELVAAASNASLYPSSRVDSLPGLRPAVPGTAVPPPSLVPPAVKDVNYYKSLIKQHGGERQDNLPQFSSGSNQHLGLSQVSVNSSKPRDSKHKIMKPCMFYNTARGCRNGANCPFQHDSSSQPSGNGIPDVQHAKRMKMDRDITGT
ncbi:hypothetical protein Leryth_014711 [Lithospermum erythrorhizon]|nr:hypothetical protein Leryth_014711 [Lithospermum erythrorhizon]